MDNEHLIQTAIKLAENKWRFYRQLVKFLEQRKFKRDGVRQVNLTAGFHAKVKENQFLMEALVDQRQKASMKFDKKMVFVYNLAIKALRKYPVQILHPEQTQLLQGVGEQMVRVMYSTFISARRNFKNLKKGTKKSRPVVIDNSRITEFLESIHPNSTLSSLQNRIETSVILLLDNRESLSISDSDSLLFAKRTLALGDMIWIAQLNYKHGSTILCQEEYVLDCIIERKKHKDLLSSNFTRHLQDQLSRLSDSSFLRKYLLIESKTLDSESLKVYNSIYLDTDFSVLYTKTEKQTIQLLSSISKNLKTQLESMTLEKLRNRESFESYQAKNRKNDTIHEVFIRFLMSFRGMRSDKAQKLGEQYPTFSVLYSAWRENRDELEHYMKWCNIGDSLRNCIFEFMKER
jgi:ERCC4-type nuclease